jgi:hypothetical protein
MLAIEVESKRIGKLIYLKRLAEEFVKQHNG